jgi:glutamate/aspartate transport system substrate-binding protein
VPLAGSPADNFGQFDILHFGGNPAGMRMQIDPLERRGAAALVGTASARSSASRTKHRRCLFVAALLSGRAATVLVLFALSAIAAVAQPLEGRLKVVHDTGTLRIAYRTDSAPFSFLDTGGRPTGYSVELCERIGKSIERELALSSLAITWVPVDANTRFQAIIEDLADIECGSSTISLSRMRIVDFSSIVFADSTGLVVRTGTGISNFESVAGRRIGVVPGSTNSRAIRDQLDRRRLDATLVEFGDREAGFAALTRGEVDGFATDKLVLLSLMQRVNRRDLVLLPDDLSIEPFAIVLPRGDWAFRLAINTGLAKIFRSGEIVQIYSKYFRDIGFHPSGWLGAVFAFGGLPD